MDSSDRFKSEDPFLAQYQPSELMTASEFLMTWLPFLSRDLCEHCTDNLSHRIRSLVPEAVEPGSGAEVVEPGSDAGPSNVDAKQTFYTSNPGLVDQDDNWDANSVTSSKDGADTNSLGSWKDGVNGWSEPMPEASVETPAPRISWADMVQEDELEGEEEEQQSNASRCMVDVNASPGGLRVNKVVEKPKLSRDQREHIRFMNVNRKKDFICFERVNGKLVNILEGLELHTGIFSAAEQKRIVDRVYALQEMGKEGVLKERTYSAPKKWMKGKGRVTLQFGCCYNYATDKNGNPPGILHDELVDPVPELFKVIIRRLVRWHVLPPTCVPDSCIVNIYEEGDCIPPHIDNHDFVRPFCTVSFLSECDILFGSNLKIVGPGEFSGSFAIPLPVGSVLVLNGNGADVAKHCVPAVPKKRISITFRRMDDTKRPNGYTPEPDLQGLEPLSYEAEKIRHNSPKSDPYPRRQPIRRDVKTEARGILGTPEPQGLHFSSRGRRFPPNKRRPRLSLGS